MATPTITAADLAAPLALDATIAALCDFYTGAPTAPNSPFNWAPGARDMFTALRTQLDIDAAATAREFIAEQAVIAEATSCGYIATRKSTRAARHASYSNGTRTPPARETAADRARAEAVAWGWRHELAAKANVVR